MPKFKAGDSLIVTTPSSDRRNYSICNDEIETHRYLIAVKNAATSRGGSRSMHESASPGTELSAELACGGLSLASGHHHLLVAGGIGITPMLSLAQKLAREGDGKFDLLYIASSRDEAAYADVLETAEFRDRVTLHFSSEHGGRRYDLRPWLRDNGGGRHLYYCGPPSMMEALRLMSIHWPREMVHFESFGRTCANRVGDEPFRIRQSTTGRLFHVGKDQSILDALREGGLEPAAGCESGTCGKCRLLLIFGEVDHRDAHLAPEERLFAIMPCVSRGVDVIELEF